MSDEIRFVPTNAIQLTISRELALDYGLIEPKPEELHERNESGRRFHANQRAIRSKFIDAIDALREKGGLTVEILNLHAPDVDAQWSQECPGCDFGGYEGEPPDWPCRTVRALATHHGIDMPGGDLPGKRYEDEFVPFTGKPFRPPLSRWHFTSIEDTPVTNACQRLHPLRLT